MVVGDSMGFMSIEINESFVVLNDCCKVSGCFNVCHVMGLVGADPSDMVVSPSCKCHAGPSANAVSGGAGYSADNITNGYGCYSAPFEEPQVIFHSAGGGLQFVLPKTKLATTDHIVQLGHAGWVCGVQVYLWQHEYISQVRWVSAVPVMFGMYRR